MQHFKKSMGIAKRVCIISCLCVIVVALIIGMVSTILFMQFTNSLQQEETYTGVQMLQSEVEGQLQILQFEYNALSKDIGEINQKDYEEIWNKNKISETDFWVVLKGNEIVWQSDNIDVSTQLVEKVSNNGGLIKDNDKLYLAYSGVEQNGLRLIVGMDLSNEGFIDNIKERIGVELTLFCDDVRYITTLLNDKGARNIGTKMNAEIWEEMKKGKTFIDKVEINQKTYYTNYKPMYDTNKNIIGAYFAGYPTSKADSELFRVIVSCVISLLILCVFAALVIIWLMRRYVKKPIEEVIEIAQELKNGELDAKDSDFAFVNDELGLLAETITEAKHTLDEYVGDIVKVLEEMGTGDFSIQSKVEYIGSFKSINTSFKNIKETLSDIISNMNISADDVANGTSQLADGSQMLAEGATKQATAVDELSSTISNIAEQVNNNAKHAIEAKSTSDDCEEKIKIQQEKMEKLLGAMGEIEEKAEEISKIIKTIEDIAFQTNILSLNASIEAARAGESGKGFAVVANEVGALAAKSAEAAKNTANLILATKEAVGQGSEFAKETADNLRNVIELTDISRKLVEEITVASKEQADAVNQVTIGIEQISDVVQQNSATAEESAASCEELSAQARLLKEQVDKLKV